MAINIQCEACGQVVASNINTNALKSTPVASILPVGWGITGVPDVTPTALLCGNCRTFIGGYTIASFMKVLNHANQSGSASAITLVSGTNASGSYTV